jgi:hypothetical protein
MDKQCKPNYSSVPTSALVALALLILKRARLSSIPVTNREQAIRVILGVHPAPPRKSTLHIKANYELCCICYKPMITGTPCDSLGRRHAHCEERLNKVHENWREE